MYLKKSMNDLNHTSEEFCNEDFLKSIGKENPFVVPDGYFDRLTELTLFHAKLDSEHLDFEVPEEYFKESEERILNEIRLRSRLESQAQVQEEFSIPEGYFNDLTQKINRKIEQERVSEVAAQSEISETPIIPIPASKEQKGILRRIWGSGARYIAAACLIVVGTIFFRNIGLNENSVNFESLSDEEIAEYLYTYGGTGDLIYISEAINSDSHDAFQEMNDLSDEEIRWYLENSL